MGAFLCVQRDSNPYTNVVYADRKDELLKKIFQKIYKKRLTA